jgi:hypothetical protein
MINLALTILSGLFLILVAVVVFAVGLIVLEKAVTYLVDFFHI